MAEIRRQARLRNPSSPAEALREQKLEDIVRAIRWQIRRYGLTPEQLFAPDLEDLVQYRDPETGKTWNGHGRPPTWLKGKDRARYRIG
ncbi:H-NS histone family protein [Cupriavidus basilensis]